MSEVFPLAETKKAASALVEQTKQKVLDEYEKQYGFIALPGERELAVRYGVSRPTLHKALLLLEENGKIVRVKGKGSFFMGEKKFANRSHTKVLGFTDNVISHGHSPSSRILVQNVEPADEKLANIFSVNPGDQIFHMRSLAFIDNELYAMIDDYVDNSRHPRLLNMDFTKAAILNELAADGCVIATMRGLLEIRPANNYEAMNLNLKIGSPITVFQNTAYDQAQNAVIHSVVRSLAYETSYEIYTDCQI